MTNMKKLRGIIEDTLQDERDSLDRYELEIPARMPSLHQGWIEALEYVLHQMKGLEGEE